MFDGNMSNEKTYNENQILILYRKSASKNVILLLDLISHGSTVSPYFTGNHLVPK